MISNLEVAQGRHAGITFLKTTDKSLLNLLKTVIDIFATVLKKTTKSTLKKQSGGQLIIVETSVYLPPGFREYHGESSR